MINSLSRDYFFPHGKTPLYQIRKTLLDNISPHKVKLSLGGKNALTNLGNTCFLNTALQCLCHLEPLVAYFLSGHFKDETNYRAKLGSKDARVTIGFAEVMLRLWSSPRFLLWEQQCRLTRKAEKRDPSSRRSSDADLSADSARLSRSPGGAAVQGGATPVRTSNPVDTTTGLTRETSAHAGKRNARGQTQSVHGVGVDPDKYIFRKVDVKSYVEFLWLSVQNIIDALHRTICKICPENKICRVGGRRRGRRGEVAAMTMPGEGA